MRWGGLHCDFFAYLFNSFDFRILQMSCVLNKKLRYLNNINKCINITPQPFSTTLYPYHLGPYPQHLFPLLLELSLKWSLWLHPHCHFSQFSTEWSHWNVNKIMLFLWWNLPMASHPSSVKSWHFLDGLQDSLHSHQPLLLSCLWFPLLSDNSLLTGHPACSPLKAFILLFPLWEGSSVYPAPQAGFEVLVT